MVCLVHGIQKSSFFDWDSTMHIVFLWLSDCKGNQGTIDSCCLFEYIFEVLKFFEVFIAIIIFSQVCVDLRSQFCLNLRVFVGVENGHLNQMGCCISTSNKKDHEFLHYIPLRSLRILQDQGFDDIFWVFSSLFQIAFIFQFVFDGDQSLVDETLAPVSVDFDFSADFTVRFPNSSIHIFDS